MGRVLAYNTKGKGVEPVNEVRNWVEKALAYEKNPGKVDGLNKVLHSCPVTEDADPFNPDCKQLYGYTDGHYPPGFEVTCLGTKAHAHYHIDFINSYFPGIVVAYAHGYTTYWAVWNSFIWAWNPGPPWYRPLDAELGLLANESGYFVAYLMPCLNATYDHHFYHPFAWEYTDTTVTEALLEAYPGKGAAACVANTRYGWPIASPEIYQKFLDQITGGYYLIGVADALSKPAWNPNPGPFVCECVYSLNDFGSPLTEVWTDVPQKTYLSLYPRNIQYGVPTTVRVAVTYFDGEVNRPLRGARVTLYGAEYYKVKYTNPQGKADFVVIAPITGRIVATATKHDYLPSEAYIEVTGWRPDLAANEELPHEFFMSLASSNPVKGDLRVKFGIPLENEGPVSLMLYDVSGRVAVSVLSGEKPAGYYDLFVPVGSLSTGTYFLRLEAGAKTKTEKIVLR